MSDTSNDDDDFNLDDLDFYKGLDFPNATTTTEPPVAASTNTSVEPASTAASTEQATATYTKERDNEWRRLGTEIDPVTGSKTTYIEHVSIMLKEANDDAAPLAIIRRKYTDGRNRTLSLPLTVLHAD